MSGLLADLLPDGFEQHARNSDQLHSVRLDPCTRRGTSCGFGSGGCMILTITVGAIGTIGVDVPVRYCSYGAAALAIVSLRCGSVVDTVLDHSTQSSSNAPD